MQGHSFTQHDLQIQFLTLRTYMGIDGLIKVLMLFDECLHIIPFGIYFFCL